MAVEDFTTPPPPPPINMEKPFDVANIKAHVPLTLDLEQLNYDAWSELFTTHYAVNGLGDKYEHVGSIIRHSKNPLSLLETRSMLLLEDSRLNRKQTQGTVRDTPSSSTVLMTATTGSGSKGNGKKELCRNFQRGYCRFGARCKYLHGKQTGNTHAFPPQGHYPQPNNGQALGPTVSILGPAPNQSTSNAYGPYGPRPHAPGYWEYSDQPTTLPRAFNATTLRYADNNEDLGWQSTSDPSDTLVLEDLRQDLVNKARVVMSSASSAVTYTSVYTDSEPGVF
ncbi:ribonuclease H-like domain-containing protein [Tanacetum coccineum]